MLNEKKKNSFSSYFNFPNLTYVDLLTINKEMDLKNLHFFINCTNIFPQFLIRAKIPDFSLTSATSSCNLKSIFEFNRPHQQPFISFFSVLKKNKKNIYFIFQINRPTTAKDRSYLIILSRKI